jgi:hypothetical protein
MGRHFDRIEGEAAAFNHHVQRRTVAIASQHHGSAYALNVRPRPHEVGITVGKGDVVKMKQNRSVVRHCWGSPIVNQMPVHRLCIPRHAVHIPQNTKLF